MRLVHVGHTLPTVVLATVLCNVECDTGDVVACRVLLDSGSTATLEKVGEKVESRQTVLRCRSQHSW